MKGNGVRNHTAIPPRSSERGILAFSREGKMKYVGFKDYVKDILKTAQYKNDEDIGCVVAVVPALPGCMTQGDHFEEARDLLIDAIELWITVALREGAKMPSINGVDLVTAAEHLEQDPTIGASAHA